MTAEQRTYRYLIFDADDTLVDYGKDSRRAFRAALSALGRENDEALMRAMVEFDYGNWDAVGLSDVHLPAVQTAYHDLYRTHVRGIFEHADRICSLEGKARQAEEAFLDAFSMPGQEIPGARRIVAELRKRYRVYAATNGLSSLQRRRLSEFSLDGIFISEEIGAIKPNADFFRYILHALSAAPSECLVVGDSLSSDIAGAQAAGIDCVWFNRSGGVCPSGVREIKDLAEIFTFL